MVGFGSGLDPSLDLADSGLRGTVLDYLSFSVPNVML